MSNNILIYEFNSTDSDYDLKYTIDNCDNFSISKNAPVMTFTLPIVDEGADEQFTRYVDEKIDIVKITGVNMQCNFSFVADVDDIQTLLDLVGNEIEGKTAIVAESWSAKAIIGKITDVQISQAGGEGVINVRITHESGKNILDDLGF